MSPLTGTSFAGMNVSYDDGNTVLEGPVRDQSELHGLLRRCLDLGLTLLSVGSDGNGLPRS